MNDKKLWTVTYLTEAGDSLWTDLFDWTGRPQPDHSLLGQVSNIVDLTTATWITARLDDAVTHTDHSCDVDYIFFFWGKRKKGGQI